MAFFTSDSSMLTFQFERGEVMVKVRIFPCRWVMAILTLTPILTVVFILLIVAGVAILGCGLEVYE